MGTRLYVGNIPYETGEDALRELFGHGVGGCHVTDVKIVMDRATGRPRGFAFVEVERPDDARRSVETLNGSQFGGRTIVVNEAREPLRNAAAAGRGGNGEARRGR